jgi:hypothetical protein
MQCEGTWFVCSFLALLRKAVLRVDYASYMTDRLGTCSTVSH